MVDGVGLVAADQHVDVAVERGGEQHRLALRVGLVEQAAHLGQEAHVGHAVGLVDHDEVDVVEAQRAAVEEVLEPAGRGDDDLDALAERLHLLVHAGAAVHGEHLGLGAPAQRLQLLLHLRGELAGGHEHEALGPARAPPSRCGRSAGGRRRWSCRSRWAPCRRRRGRRGRRGRVAAWTGKGSVMPSSSRRAHRWAGTPRAAKVGGMDGSLVERSRRLQGGGLKPQLDTARQRLLAPEHCTGQRPRSPPLGSGAMEPVMARKMWRTLEPYHGMIYFAPEATAAYEALGVMGFDGYFASRAAPMGAVPAEVVVATFFNFNPAIVHHAIPARVAGDHAGAAARGAARRAPDARCGERPATSSTTRRCARAAELARIAAEACTAAGRPLYAGHAGLAVARRAARSRSGTPSRCCASSAATATSPAWSRPASTASTRSCSTPPPARCPAPRCRARGSGTTPRGTRRSRRLGERGSSTATAPSPRRAPPCASTSRTAPTRWPCRRGGPRGGGLRRAP